jgi:spore coat protein U-like protein
MARLSLLAGGLLVACATSLAHAACSVSGVRLRFPQYEPNIPAGVTSHSTIVVTCTDAMPPTVTILLGPSGTSGGFLPRQMAQSGGAGRIAYNLYVDPGTSVVWGDGSPGTATRSERVPRNQPWVSTVYGRVLPDQDPAPGDYTDSITVTIGF